jgi:flagellar basal body-associated protein FliL
MAETVPPPAVKPRRRGKLLLALILLVIVAVLGVALYVWVTLHINYSEGERAGYIQKFSRKGWVCKTWEGELAMVNLPGAMPELFRFSVRDEATATRLNQTLGKRVRVHYEQHKGVPTACFGETEYFVTSVEPVGP